MATELRDTLNLPVTDFPMRANLTAREPKRIAFWEKTGLYRRLQEKNAGTGKLFVLHDGPPFTNGDVHIGTALNKLLKDIIMRYKTMRGFRVPYVPGWDCHGLPIEHKVMKELHAKAKTLSPLEIRRACAEFSETFIEKQRAQFRRLGILADWAAEYKTKNPAYEADILRTFANMVGKGLVYRSKKPVYWSIPCRTALAEAEIEYKNHVSTSIWVAFTQVDAPEKNFVIWTTTPWTIPANVAVAVHPDLDYVEISCGGKIYVVAEALAEKFIADCGLEGAAVVAKRRGNTLEGIRTRHPICDRVSPVVCADYITTDAGTGCVHTAGGHGLEDYQTCLRCGIEIYCPVNDDGVYENDGRVPAELVGLSVLDANGKCPANEGVLRLLEKSGKLLKTAKIEHQYPHCWRSKTPVIFRAMGQWFVALDKNGMRDEALKQIGGVEWVPASGENRIRAAVEGRPDWCISRQRSWGVPIPVFYEKDTREAFLDAGVVRGIADKVASAGTDIWFAQTPAELLAGIDVPANWPSPEKLEKGADTLDVWIDSGSSNAAVLKRNPELAFPADLYLEGSDQHRGWFQSSLWTSVVNFGCAPYKKVITHGFVVNEGTRQKISKSDGKPQTADGYVSKYGADIVRLWIASENYRSDIPLSDGILDATATQYRNIRNTIRYQLSNLYDFDPAKDAVPFAELTPIDKWALTKFSRLLADVTKFYEDCEFHKAYAAIDAFTVETLSATYHNILKDRLYTFAANSRERRSSQTAIHAMLSAYLKMLAPMLPFTTDEAWGYFTAGGEYAENSVLLQDWPAPRPELEFPEEAADFDALLALLDDVNQKLDELRSAKVIGQSLEAVVSISADPASPTFALLKKYAAQLAETFIVSEVVLKEAPAGTPVSVDAVRAESLGYVRCPRSWRWVPELADAGAFGKVSPRCLAALKEKYPAAF